LQPAGRGDEVLIGGIGPRRSAAPRESAECSYAETIRDAGLKSTGAWKEEARVHRERRIPVTNGVTAAQCDSLRCAQGETEPRPPVPQIPVAVPVVIHRARVHQAVVGGVVSEESLAPAQSDRRENVI